MPQPDLSPTAVLFDTDSERASVLNRALIEIGYEVLARIKIAAQLSDSVLSSQPDILIIGTDAPDTLLLDQLTTIHNRNPRPVVVFAEKGTPNIIAQVIKIGVSAYVVNDVQPQRLESIVNVAIARFDEDQRLRDELTSTRSKLEDRKKLEKAKGLIMKQHNISEDEAYKCLRKMAMDKGLSLSVAAQMIIDVFSMHH